MQPTRATRSMSSHTAPITRVSARTYQIPTESPEADGTIDWQATTLILAEIEAGGVTGLGYSYASRGCLAVIENTLLPAIKGLDAFDIARCSAAMQRAVRNLGRSGVAACAISAVDCALWDAKAKLLGVPLIALLGRARDSIPVYGSGGFTTQGPPQVARQIDIWVKQSVTRFKIKIGRDDAADDARLSAARAAMPEGSALFVDANGAYHPKRAMHRAQQMGKFGITWFEEPVSSDDTEGLRFVRGRSHIDIAAGEYCYNPDDARRLLEADAVDVLQADATRALGLSGFLQIAHLAAAHHRPLSSHCAPALHVAVMCHVADGMNLEYFSDHARIEAMLFDGVSEVRDGCLTPQSDRPGFGFALKTKDAERYAL